MFSQLAACSSMHDTGLQRDPARAAISWSKQGPNKFEHVHLFILCTCMHSPANATCQLPSGDKITAAGAAAAELDVIAGRNTDMSQRLCLSELP